MLIDTLRALEALGWVVRHDYSNRIKWVEYSIEESGAEQIRRLIAELVH
jgi:DNA-binding HxlR family transcriptional regulator